MQQRPWTGPGDKVSTGLVERWEVAGPGYDARDDEWQFYLLGV
jgi:hypothetical protein